ncbi:MAG TPA: fluoride efflux transporter CrcB [Solirubrobacterales bacterium]|nr:fluoride efflux transporter CrcB [Solirubrobacterales bacterium]
MGQRRFDRRELGAIYAGGVIGALARVGLAEALPHGVGSWPWATFVVNLVGAALLGWFVTRLGERLPPSQYGRPFLGTGICGALTTFSTLQLELFEMLEAGCVGLAAGYAAATLAGGFACVHLGTAATRRARVLR